MEFPLDITKPWATTAMSVPSFFVVLAWRIMANCARKFNRDKVFDIGANRDKVFDIGAVFYKGRVYIYIPDPDDNMVHAMDSKKWHLKDSVLNRAFLLLPYDRSQKGSFDDQMIEKVKGWNHPEMEHEMVWYNSEKSKPTLQAWYKVKRSHCQGECPSVPRCFPIYDSPQQVRSSEWKELLDIQIPREDEVQEPSHKVARMDID